MLEVALELSTFPGLHLMDIGQILRVREILDFPDSHRHFEVAVEFTDIHEDDRDEIIRYTFRRQRELLRTQRLNNTDLQDTGVYASGIGSSLMSICNCNHGRFPCKGLFKTTARVA